mgnify:CR=1 FL=1
MINELTDTFPFESFSLDKNNHRHDISSSSIQDYSSISNTWKDFIEFHSSKYFFGEVVEIFKDYLNLDYKLNQFLKSDSLIVGRRQVESFKEADVLMDAQISINSPVVKQSSVRKIHVDSPNKIFSGLFYLRMPDDDSVGGDLQLCKWKSEYSKKEKLKFYKEGVSEDYVNVVEEISYQSNTLVLFPNSIDALHGVTERHMTKHTRTFVNLIAEIPFDLYIKENFFKRQIFRLRTFLSKVKKIIVKTFN